MPFRNPIVVLCMTLIEAIALSVLVMIPVPILRALPVGWEVPLFYSVAAMALAGGLCGRSGTFSFVAFPITLVGSFIGYTAFTALVLPPVRLEFSVLYALIASVSAWMVAIWKSKHLRESVHLQNDDFRRCRQCGVRVGLSAKKCWSCRASLNQLI